MKADNNVPIPVLRRMPSYLSFVKTLQKQGEKYVSSTRIAEYHPFKLYLDELPAWDGTDRLEALAQRVSANGLWKKEFHTWMLGMTAQWLGITGAHANSVAPLLVSKEQGGRNLHFASLCFLRNSNVTIWIR